ncbi:MAG: hypothetical protein V1674_03795 [Candidatus Omnitrophota bacterium]
MIKFILGVPLKDWIILATLGILIWCIFEIKRLKKTVAQEVRSRLIPQLNLEIDTNSRQLILKNESFFLAKDIRIEALEIILEDYGFKKHIGLRFNNIDALRPKEKIKLEFKAFDANQELPQSLVEKMILHLMGADFKVKIYYSNIENTKFCIGLVKKRDRMHIEGIEVLANANA